MRDIVRNDFESEKLRNDFESEKRDTNLICLMLGAASGSIIGLILGIVLF